ncbi:hypothetical protein MRX96_035626 [Rhipicephalus microplus]|nr:signal recognition particle receptor subunit beta-like [Rhipicephalus microplus]XP_037288026.1 signal recognition particle receptor subunit beta-like [Rhipicephalus microplus]
MAADASSKSVHMDVKTNLFLTNPSLMYIIIALVVVIITTIIFFQRRKNLRRGVLIVGLSDAGKTLLFSQLVGLKKVHTYTSIKENKASYKIPKKGSLNLIDLPGHDRIRVGFLDYFKGLARAVLFVVDSAKFPQEVRDVAEFLYNLLCDPVISQHCPPIMIVCNKQDAPMAKSPKVIQSQLEKEMNVLRTTQISALESTEGQANKNTFLGKRGKDFQFSDVRPIVVEFAEFSAKSPEEAQLSVLKSWLAKVA